jgi:hypothetical protein
MAVQPVIMHLCVAVGVNIGTEMRCEVLGGIYPAQDRDNSRAVVDTVMNFRI